MSLFCRTCDRNGDEASMIMCSACECTHHMTCAGLQAAKPEGWRCSACAARSPPPQPCAVCTVDNGTAVLQCQRCANKVHPGCYGYLANSHLAFARDQWTCRGCTPMEAPPAAAEAAAPGNTSTPPKQAEQKTAVRRSSRAAKSRIVDVDGHSVLASNLYDLEDGEPGVAAELDRRHGVGGDGKIAEVNGAGATAILPLVTAAFRQFQNTEASIGQLVYWVSTHHSDRFAIAAIPQLVALALKSGLARGQYRCTKVVSASDDPNVEIDALGPELSAAWEANGTLLPARLMLASIRPKTAAKQIFRAAVARELYNCVPWPRREDTCDRVTVLERMISAGLVDQLPLASVSGVYQRGDTSADAWVYCPRHMFRLRSTDEDPENMKAFAEAITTGEPLVGGIPKAVVARPQTAAEKSRMSHNAQLAAESAELSKMRDVYLARHRNAMRAFLPPAEAARLDAVAAAHHMLTAADRIAATAAASCGGGDGGGSAMAAAAAAPVPTMSPATNGSANGSAAAPGAAPATNGATHMSVAADDTKAAAAMAAAAAAAEDVKPWLNPLYAVQDTPPYVKHPEGLMMRPHQLEGLAWLSYMHRHGCSAILGDEMGLGKTLQTIAFLGHLKWDLHLKGASLIVCPLSVLTTWLDEFKAWCPDLRVARLHSSAITEREHLKKAVLGNLEEYDAVITTYEMCTGDLKHLLSRMHVWRYVVLDEGHKIKNEEAMISQVVRRIRCQGKLLLTGTPLQNNLHELWALLNYLLPDTFKDSAPFDKAYDVNTGQVEEKMLASVHFVLAPFILRRLKSEVETSLPPRGVIEVSVPLTKAQHFWYRQLLQRDSDVLQRLEGSATATTNEDGVVLAPAGNDWKRLQSLMMQLRKCCNHPYLFPGADPDPEAIDEGLVRASGKMVLLDRLLPRLKARGHRVCLFSQFTSTLDLVQDYCTLRGYRFRRIDGSVNRVRRAISIAEFQKPGSKVFIFIMSTRAGGLGITLTSADTVIMFDSDWNPMVDLQAMARVHRIGQKKAVAVYRLVTAGTVEQRMVQRAQKKMFLDRIVNRGSSKQAEEETSMSFKEMLDMFRFGMQAAMRTDLATKEITEEQLEAILDRSGYTTAEAQVQHMGSSVEESAEAAAADGAPPADSDAAAANAADTAVFDPRAVATSLTSFGGVEYRGKKGTPVSLRDLAAAFHAELGIGAMRERKSRFKTIDGHTVLALNDYDLGKTLSVYDVEKQGGRRAAAVPAKRRRQVAGQDYSHIDLCLNCWDGGEVICCDICPAVYHASCIGMNQRTIEKMMHFACPQHYCADCGRKTGEAGGLLFRCLACPQAYCEDHAPVAMTYVGECKRYKALGQKHPPQAYFIYCTPQCREFGHRVAPYDEEADESDDQQDTKPAASAAAAPASGKPLAQHVCGGNGKGAAAVKHEHVHAVAAPISGQALTGSAAKRARVTKARSD